MEGMLTPGVKRSWSRGSRESDKQVLCNCHERPVVDLVSSAGSVGQHYS